MAIPLHCPHCGELVGMESESATVNRIMGGISLETAEMNLPHCPGKENHFKPIHHYAKAFFGWIVKHRILYPETSTETEAKVYAGPKKRFALWLLYAVHLEKDERLFYNNESIYKGTDGKLTGKGLLEMGIK